MSSAHLFQSLDVSPISKKQQLCKKPKTKQINQEAPDFERSLDFRPTKEVKQFTQQKQQPPQKLKTLLQQVNKRI
jgi:hypothetical protein